MDLEVCRSKLPSSVVEFRTSIYEYNTLLGAAVLFSTAIVTFDLISASPSLTEDACLCLYLSRQLPVTRYPETTRGVATRLSTSDPFEAP